ncbi:MAG: hypothetical protein EOO77_08525 [Oxalobacteraceae bacterium]|nr:MAG: hypothetical protein EOO77_08525 [Oxalobacteraceae bacterium]
MYLDPEVAALMSSTTNHAREARRCRRLASGIGDAATFSKLIKLAEQHDLCASILEEGKYGGDRNGGELPWKPAEID